MRCLYAGALPYKSIAANIAKWPVPGTQVRCLYSSTSSLQAVSAQRLIKTVPADVAVCRWGPTRWCACRQPPAALPPAPQTTWWRWPACAPAWESHTSSTTPTACSPPPLAPASPPHAAKVGRWFGLHALMHPPVCDATGWLSDRRTPAWRLSLKDASWAQCVQHALSTMIMCYKSRQKMCGAPHIVCAIRPCASQVRVAEAGLQPHCVHLTSCPPWGLAHPGYV